MKLSRVCACMCSCGYSWPAESMRDVLEEFGCSSKCLHILQQFHSGVTAKVVVCVCVCASSLSRGSRVAELVAVNTLTRGHIKPG